MIPTIPQSKFYKTTYTTYVVLFFIYLMAPLAVVAVFSFNESMFPYPPWQGFTLDWYLSSDQSKLGLFFDSNILESIGISAWVAFWVTLLALFVGLCNAFLFEREQFWGKSFFYILMLTPLVIPGVILGVSLLVFSNTLAMLIENNLGWEIESLRPGLVLVVLGQFAFITTITTLVISARLRKFDTMLEEAACDLGATKLQAIRSITIPYLKPALFGAGIVCFLMSFENFNTTLMLVGSDSPLTITLFDRLRQGSTPILNAVSLVLMVASGGLALLSVFVQRKS